MIEKTIDHAAVPAILLVGVLSLPLCAQTAGGEPGFESLFDGESLEGWVGDKSSYSAADGVLSSKQGAGGNLYTARQFADFAFRFEFRLTPGANNGIGLRAPGTGDAAYTGMECQVLDNTAKQYKNLKPWQAHGSIYGVAAAERGALKPAGEWNEQTILCQGDRVSVTLNDQVILDVDLAEAAPDGKTIDGREHPGLFRKSGHIGLLGHGAVVEFRNLAVRELPPPGP
ncbi:MAG: DUF1080 domain-containing protein [Planctomycetota bacterium]